MQTGVDVLYIEPSRFTMVEDLSLFQRETFYLKEGVGERREL